MSTSHKTSPPPPEDIDILALLERAVIFFRKYKWIFIVAVVVGLGTGYLTYRKLPTVYKSRMIVHSFTLSNEDFIQVIDNYNTLIKKHELEQVSAAFEIPVQVLGKVKQIKSTQIQKVFTANNPNGFYIDVFVTDNAILGELQKGIVNGLENIEYIRKQLAIKKANIALLISEVEKEIGKLDSTKSNVERSLDGKGTHSSSLIVDISGINKQLIDMKEKLLNYKSEIQFLTAIQVLQGFSAFSRPAGPNMLVWLGLGLIGALVLAYCFALFHSIREKLKTRSRQRIE